MTDKNQTAVEHGQTVQLKALEEAFIRRGEIGAQLEKRVLEAERDRDLYKRQLERVDQALPLWKGTGRGRIETIQQLLPGANGGVTLSPEPKRIGVYIASKTKHAPKWKALRESGVPIISTWIDEAGIGETKCFTDLWRRCIDEAKNAERMIVYAEDGDELKGALVEVGAALAGGTPVYVVGKVEPLKTARNHRLVTEVSSLEEALRATTPTPSQPPTPSGEGAKMDARAIADQIYSSLVLTLGDIQEGYRDIPRDKWVAAAVEIIESSPVPAAPLPASPERIDTGALLDAIEARRGEPAPLSADVAAAMNQYPELSTSPEKPLEPRCQKCGNKDLRWSNSRTIIYCYRGEVYPEHSFDVSPIENFAQFFAAPPEAQEAAQPEVKNSCNRHNDCAKANAEYLKRTGATFVPFSFHCHSEDCEDCFGQ